MTKRTLSILLTAMLIMTTFPAGTATADAPNTVAVNGTFSDGSSVTYGLQNSGDAGTPTLTVTGTTETDHEDKVGRLSGDSSVSVDVAGDKTPTNAELTITVQGETASEWDTVVGSGTYSFTESEVPDTIKKVEVVEAVNNGGSSGSGPYFIDVIVHNETRSITACSDWKVDAAAEGQIVRESQTCTVDASLTGPVDVDIESSGDEADADRIEEGVTLVGAAPDTVTATVNGETESFSGLQDGYTKSSTINLGTGSNSIDIDVPRGSVRYTVDWTERQTTPRGSVIVNGETASFNHLSDGETASLDVPQSALKDGENQLNVSLDAPADAPDPTVDVDYEHSSEVDTSISYTSDAHTETIEYQHVMQSDGDSTVMLPITSETAHISTVEVNTGDGWTAADDVSITDGRVSVDVTDLNTDETLQVRVEGERLDTENGDVTVLQRSIGGTMDAKVSVSESGSFHFDFDGSDRLHDAYDSGWDSNDYSRVSATGTQELHLPNAQDGQTVHITETSIGVTPDSGAAAVQMIETGVPTRYRVVDSGPITGDTLTTTLHNAENQETYSIYDLDGESLISSSTAYSGTVSFETSDRTGAVKVYQGGESSSILGPVGESASDTFSDLFLMSGAVGVLLLVAFIQRRFGLGRARDLASSPLFVVSAGLVGVVTLDVISGNALTEALSSGLSRVVPVLGIIGAIILAWYFYKRFIKGQDTKIVVSGRSK